MFGDRPITVEEMRQYVRDNYDGKELDTPDIIRLKDGLVFLRSYTHPDLYHVIQNGHCTCSTWKIYEKNGKSWCGHLMQAEE